jgi:hypothetical protein
MSPSAITLMLADLGDQVVVPGPVEHHRGDVPHLASERLCDRLQVLGHALAQVDAALRDRADGHLLHVHARHPRDAARLAGGQDRERAHPASADHRRTFDRVAGQLQLHSAAAHGRARRQRVALLAAADHDSAADGQRVDRTHHRLAGGRVGTARVTPTQISTCGQGAALADRRQVGAGAAFLRQLRLRPGLLLGATSLGGHGRG